MAVNEAKALRELIAEGEQIEGHMRTKLADMAKEERKAQESIDRFQEHLDTIKAQRAALGAAADKVKAATAHIKERKA